jgi:hypothetical protein
MVLILLLLLVVVVVINIVVVVMVVVIVAVNLSRSHGLNVSIDLTICPLTFSCCPADRTRVHTSLCLTACVLTHTLAHSDTFGRFVAQSYFRNFNMKGLELLPAIRYR